MKYDKGFKCEPEGERPREGTEETKNIKKAVWNVAATRVPWSTINGEFNSLLLILITRHKRSRLIWLLYSHQLLLWLFFLYIQFHTHRASSPKHHRALLGGYLCLLGKHSAFFPFPSFQSPQKCMGQICIFLIFAHLWNGNDKNDGNTTKTLWTRLPRGLTTHIWNLVGNCKGSTVNLFLIAFISKVNFIG